MKLSQLLENDLDLEQSLTDKYNLTRFSIHNRPSEIVLSMIEVPKAERKNGVGTAVMNDLITYADSHNKRIVLTPDSPNQQRGTTSSSRLIKFYKRFGFVENKGRNKDYSISDGMYRLPR